MCICRHPGATHCLPDAELPELQQAELQTLLQRLVLQFQGSGVGGQVLHRGCGAVWTCGAQTQKIRLCLSASVSAIELNIKWTIFALFIYNSCLMHNFLTDERGILGSSMHHFLYVVSCGFWCLSYVDYCSLWLIFIVYVLYLSLHCESIFLRNNKVKKDACICKICKLIHCHLWPIKTRNC